MKSNEIMNEGQLILSLQFDAVSAENIAKTKTGTGSGSLRKKEEIDRETS